MAVEVQIVQLQPWKMEVVGWLPFLLLLLGVLPFLDPPSPSEMLLFLLADLAALLMPCRSKDTRTVANKLSYEAHVTYL